MDRYQNLKLLKKLVVGFGTIVLIVAFSSIFIFHQTTRLAEIERMNTISDATVDSIDLVKGDLASARASLRKQVVTGAASDATQFKDSFAAFTTHLAALKASIEKDSPIFLPDFAAYESATTVYAERALFVEARLASSPATRPDAVALVGSNASAPYFATVNKAFEGLRTKVAAWSADWTAQAERAMARTIGVVAISGVLCVVVSIGMAWLIAASVGRPLAAMTGVMRALAEGNTQVDVPARGQTDEIGEMAAAVQVFKDAALSKRRLESETAEARRAADAEKARAEASRANAAVQMTQAVDGLAKGLRKLASGDLVSRLDTAFGVDYEALRADYNAAAEQLRETLKTVSANADTIRSGTGEITAASDDLSRRTEQQAATLEQTAAALNLITTNVRKTAESAVNARDAVNSARDDAARSSNVVGSAVEAMDGIATSSRQIEQIISVIDEIAFQTNLLALNAGVEAARAGDAGRGFAVVASEVRALAQRSASAAREIKTLILTSGGQVKAGVDLVAEAGDALHRISAQINEISGAIAEIAESSKEQASSLAEVNIAMGQMDEVTQQNAAMVEEATAATRNLAKDTDLLARLVGRFKVGAERGAEPTSPHPVEDQRRTPYRSVGRLDEPTGARR